MRHLVAGLIAATTAIPGALAEAQAPPANPVRYTEAREQLVRRNVTLPGTVEARTVSPAAAEVEGFVVELLAHEGDAVSAGQGLARLRTTNLELRLRAARGELKEAEARLERAQRALHRAEELLQQELLSTGEFDDAHAEARAWEGRLETLRADTERIELDLRRCTIRSPIDGVVVAEQIDVGTWISVGDPVMEVVSSDDLDVEVEVPGRYFHDIRLEEQATVTLEMSPPHTLDGAVSAIIPRAADRSRVFPIKVRLPDRDLPIAAGMLVQVSLPVGEGEPAVIVPKDALVTRGPSQFVLVIGDDGTASRVAVEPGSGLGAWVVVRGDLQPGTRVVTRGNERLFPGQKVEGEPQDYELP